MESIIVGFCLLLLILCYFFLWRLDDIKTELKYRNTLLEEQNQILRNK